MSDKSGFRPIYTMGDETDDMVEASNARIITSSKADGFVKNVKNALIDMGIGEVVKKIISDNVTYCANREARKHANSLNRWVLPNSKILLSAKGIALAGVLGLSTSAASIWKNYHSGYSFGKATVLSLIDFTSATLSIAANFAFSPAGGLLAGLAIGMIGDMAKDAVIKKQF